MNSQLEKTFDLPTSEDMEDVQSFIEINLPTDATLKDIVRLSLEAYKVQTEMAGKVEPRFRHRTLEVAQTYLQSALDAIAKDREINLKAEKQAHDLKPKDDTPKEGEIVRDDLLKEISADKRKDMH